MPRVQTRGIVRGGPGPVEDFFCDLPPWLCALWQPEVDRGYEHSCGRLVSWAAATPLPGTFTQLGTFPPARRSAGRRLDSPNYKPATVVPTKDHASAVEWSKPLSETREYGTIAKQKASEARGRRRLSQGEPFPAPSVAWTRSWAESAARSQRLHRDHSVRPHEVRS